MLLHTERPTNVFNSLCDAVHIHALTGTCTQELLKTNMHEGAQSLTSESKVVSLTNLLRLARYSQSHQLMHIILTVLIAITAVVVDHNPSNN